MPEIKVTKGSGEKARFSIRKLKNSLKYSGADEQTIRQITDAVRDELYHGIPTDEIYKRAFELLKKKKSVYASRYKLKKAIYEMGPTGYPFEILVAQLFKLDGYNVEVGKIYEGKCVSHEVDVTAIKKGDLHLIECKYHSDETRNCDVKIPLYINSRFQDIEAYMNHSKKKKTKFNSGWVTTNTRFSKDAITYGKCVGLKLLSWNYPEGNGIKERVDRYGLYPITASNLLTAEEKEYLLKRDIVLCMQLVKKPKVLANAGLSEIRQQKVMNEMGMLCQI